MTDVSFLLTGLEGTDRQGILLAEVTVKLDPEFLECHIGLWWARERTQHHNERPQEFPWHLTRLRPSLWLAGRHDWYLWFPIGKLRLSQNHGSSYVWSLRLTPGHLTPTHLCDVSSKRAGGAEELLKEPRVDRTGQEKTDSEGLRVSQQPASRSSKGF